MNFAIRVNELNAVYGTNPNTQKCFNECVSAFVDYLKQIKEGNDLKPPR